jgi:TatD DNase family protein
MALEYFDTHAHIHFPDYGLDPEATWQYAQKEGVTRLMAVGCRLSDSQGAAELAADHEGIWASVGIHPHEAKEFLALPDGRKQFEELLTHPKVVAIGETGLDYFYNHSPVEQQKLVLEYQLHLAEKLDLPVIFHVRDAFDDFWPICDKFSIKRAVIHSFTGVQLDVGQILKRGLYIGLNGITTFTKVPEQIKAVKSIPLENIVLETDAPYLTPKPLRGSICKPEHVKLTAAFLAELRGESLEQLSLQTTKNAQRLFNLK